MARMNGYQLLAAEQIGMLTSLIAHDKRVLDGKVARNLKATDMLRWGVGEDAARLEVLEEYAGEIIRMLREADSEKSFDEISEMINRELVGEIDLVLNNPGHLYHAVRLGVFNKLAGMIGSRSLRVNYRGQACNKLRSLILNKARLLEAFPLEDGAEYAALAGVHINSIEAAFNEAYDSEKARLRREAGLARARDRRAAAKGGE